MILKKLTLLNYRNIATAELAFSPKINCFVGHNGEGKTNVIDAIHFLSLTKSAVSSIDSMNVAGGQGARVVGGGVNQVLVDNYGFQMQRVTVKNPTFNLWFE